MTHGIPGLPENLFYEIVSPKNMENQAKFWTEWLPNPPGTIDPLTSQITR